MCILLLSASWLAYLAEKWFKKKKSEIQFLKTKEQEREHSSLSCSFSNFHRSPDFSHVPLASCFLAWTSPCPRATLPLGQFVRGWKLAVGGVRAQSGRSQPSFSLSPPSPAQWAWAEEFWNQAEGHMNLGKELHGLSLSLKATSNRGGISETVAGPGSKGGGFSGVAGCMAGRKSRPSWNHHPALHQVYEELCPVWLTPLSSLES